VAAKALGVTVQKPSLDFPNVGFFDLLIAQGAVATRVGRSVVDCHEPNHDGRPYVDSAGPNAELAQREALTRIGGDGGVECRVSDSNT
jgi:hypothetical protein